MPLAFVAAGVLWGSVTVGPTMPVCVAGKPCDRPAKRVVITFTRGLKSVSTRTDDKGRYRVTLATGTWLVRVNLGMQRMPARVVVHTGTHRADISVDTGIR